jgi:uncharacterized protein (TIGR00725 family)
MDAFVNSLHNKHGHNQIKICVSGAAETGHCGIDALEKAKELGREIARQGAILVTGATTGFPLWAAMGVKEVGGISIGISPAMSEKEHVEVYKLPLDYMDLIMYTGFGYAGRDILLTRCSDAVICGCGRIGTIHEFTIALGHRPNAKIVAGLDPKKLLEDVIALVKKDKIAEYRTTKESISDTN